MNIPKLVPVTISLLLLSTTSASAQYQKAIHHISAFNQAMKARELADDKLFQNIELLSSWLLDFQKRYGHFPEVGVEQDKSIEYLKTYLQQSPYSQTGIMSNSERQPCAIFYFTELALDNRNLEQPEKCLPSSWKAKPGNIVVLTNTENRLLIWGYGADCLPLKDYKTGKYRLVYHDSQTE